jgi:hypothetical protein
MKRIWLAAAALALASAALLYSVLMVASLVSGSWLYGLGAGLVAFATGGGSYLTLGQYARLTARSRGGDRGTPDLRRRRR